MAVVTRDADHRDRYHHRAAPTADIVALSRCLPRHWR